MSSCLKRTCRQAMAGVFISCMLLPAPSVAEYLLTDLGEGVKPTGISDSGIVVGVIEDAAGTDNPTQAFFYDSTTGLTTLATDATATAVNQSGISSGYLHATPNIAQLWQSGQTLNSFSDFSQIIQANDINDHNDVVGTRLVNGLRRMFHYEEVPGTLHTLGTNAGVESWANSVNNLGQMTGGSVDENNITSLFVYDAGHLRPYQNMGSLPGFSGSEGFGINDNKDSVGIAFTESADWRGTRAVLSPLVNNLVNLGTLGNDTDSIARDINNDKVIVGQSIRADGETRAFIYNIGTTDILTANTIPGVPNTIFASSSRDQGIIRHDSRGLLAGWTDYSEGLITKTIYNVTADPDNHERLFAGSKFGIYRSLNGGDSWGHLETQNRELLKRSVYSILISYFDSDLILAGTDGGIFYSKDGGDHWQLITDQEEHQFSAYKLVARSKDHPLTLYTGTSVGIFRLDITPNEDGSYEFSLSSQNGNEDTALSRPKKVTDIAIATDTESELFVTMSTGGVASADLGGGPLAWVSHNRTLSTTVATSIVFDAKGTAYVGTKSGLFISKDKGNSWKSADAFGNNRGVYSLATATDGSLEVLYATSNDGSVLMSHNDDGSVDLGSVWTIITEGVDPPDVYSIHSFTNTVDETEILLGASSGLYFRNNEENTWAAADNTVKNIKISAITANPYTTPSTIWVGSPDQGVFKSEDSGRTWVSQNVDLGHYTIQSLAVDTSTSPETVYAATLGGVYRSDDSGSSWSEARTGLGGSPTFSILLDNSAYPPQLYAGTDKGIFRSSDRGENWIPMQSASDELTITNIMMNTITEPNTLEQTKTLYASGPSLSAGIYKSTNNELDWTRLPTPLGVEIYSFDIDPSNNHFYFGSRDGVYKSTDSGETWEHSSANAAPEDSNTFHTYVIKVIGPNELYAGTKGKGIIKSTDGGNSWSILDTGLSDATTNILPLGDSIVGITGVTNPSDPIIDPRSLWTLRDAVGINNSGQIIGWGEYDHDQDAQTPPQSHGVLLTRKTHSEDIAISETETSTKIKLPEADLQVTQVAVPNVVKQYTPITYQVIVKNLGPETATDVTFTDWLPVRGIYRYGAIQADPDLPARECIKRNHTLRCDIGNLAKDGQVQISISSEPQETNIKVLNTARAIANEYDPDMSNNTTSLESGVIQVDSCFIATAAYGSLLDPHVQTLRDFRDQYLMGNSAGRYLVQQYYDYSPPMAQIISEYESLRILTQIALTPMVYAIRYPWTAVLGLAALLFWRLRQRRLMQWKAI